MAHARRAKPAGPVRPVLPREDGLREAAAEVRRLMRRGARRPGLVALATVAFTAGVAFMAWRRPPVHVAERILRVTEARARNEAFRPTADLRGYIESVAFSHERLITVARKHGLAKIDAPGTDPARALEGVREDIALEVVRNPLLALLPDEQRPSSARVYLRYKSADPDEAVAVVDALARLIVDGEARRQLDAAQAAERAAASTVRMAERELERLRVQLVRLEGVSPRGSALEAIESAASGAASDVVDLGRLTELMKGAEKRLADAHTTYGEAAVRLRLAHERLGMDFEVLPAAPLPKTMNRRLKTGVVGGVALVLGLPLVLLVVAAFDPRIYFEEDVTRLGVAVLGHVPRASAGSSRER